MGQVTQMLLLSTTYSTKDSFFCANSVNSRYISMHFLIFLVLKCEKVLIVDNQLNGDI